MLGCDKTITIIRKEYRPDIDRDEVTAYVIRGVSWFSKLIVSPDGKGLTDKSEYKVRIPIKANLPIIPMVGDVFVLGEVSAYQNTSDIDTLEHFKVLAVGDNRRGGRPHWAVRGS